MTKELISKYSPLGPDIDAVAKKLGELLLNLEVSKTTINNLAVALEERDTRINKLLELLSKNGLSEG